MESLVVIRISICFLIFQPMLPTIHFKHNSHWVKPEAPAEQKVLASADLSFLLLPSATLKNTEEHWSCRINRGLAVSRTVGQTPHFFPLPAAPLATTVSLWDQRDKG